MSERSYWSLNIDTDIFESSDSDNNDENEDESMEVDESPVNGSGPSPSDEQEVEFWKITEELCRSHCLRCRKRLREY